MDKLNQKLKSFFKDHEYEITTLVMVGSAQIFAMTTMYFLGKSRGNITIRLFLREADGTDIPIPVTDKIVTRRK